MSKREETLGCAFGGNPRSAAKSEYEKLIQNHDWHELRREPGGGPKIMVVYSGNYNEKMMDLHPDLEKAAGVKHGEPVKAYQVVQGQAAEHKNYMTLGDTKVGQALMQAEKSGKFTEAEMDSLWRQASDKYVHAAVAQANADRTALMEFTRNAKDGSVFKQVESSTVIAKANFAMSDVPPDKDGRLPKFDKGFATDKEGCVWRM